MADFGELALAVAGVVGLVVFAAWAFARQRRRWEK